MIQVVEQDRALSKPVVSPSRRGRMCASLFAMFLFLASAGISHAQSRTALSSGTYPRVIRLVHNSDLSMNGLIVASFTVNFGGIREEDIYSSSDGKTFTQRGVIHDSDFASGLCCGTLYELPSQVGSLAAGTLLWSGSVGGQSSTQPMQLKIYKSADGGATWSYLSNCATTTNPRGVGGGLWEPEFEIASDGALVCIYSDETQPDHSQLLQEVRSYDGINWQNATFAVASANPQDRPGMAVVTKLPDETYFMSYEVCGSKACSAFSRTSSNGWNWGDPTNMGTKIVTASGQWFEHAPTNVWAPSATSANGTILLIGQMMYDASGSVSGGNGLTIFTNHSTDGNGIWSTMPAPIQVPTAYNNYCPNYSSSLLPSVDGTSVLEFASDYVGNTCTMFFNSGPILAGSITPAVTITPGTTRVTAFPLQVNVSVTGQPPAPAPTGQVTLTSSSYSSTAVLTNGSATFSIPGPLPVGQDTLAATYVGDSNYTSASSSASVTVVAAPTVTVTPAASTIATQQALNVGISVSSQSGGATPTGSVVLSSGSYSSSSVALSDGTASVTVPGGSLLVGTAQLLAAYSGDQNYDAQTGTATIDVAAGPGFSIAATPVSTTAGAPSGSSSAVTLTSFGEFTGSVFLTASIVQFNGGSAIPQNAPLFTFVPAGPVALASDSTQTATLQVNTTGMSASAAKETRSHSPFPNRSGSIALGALFLFGLPRRKNRNRRIAAIFIVQFSVITVIGCGGPKPSQAASITTPGAYLVKIAGTSGSVTAQTTVTVTVR